MKKRRVGFSISGDFITEHTRNLCKEGKTGAAWMLLQDCLPTQKQINTGFDWSQKNEKRAEKYQDWLKSCC